MQAGDQPLPGPPGEVGLHVGQHLGESLAIVAGVHAGDEGPALVVRELEHLEEGAGAIGTEGLHEVGAGVDRGTVHQCDTASDCGHPNTSQIRSQLQRIPGEGVRVFPPKTARSRRTVPIPATVVGVLRAHRDEQDARRELAGEAWAPGGFVFDRGEGSPMHPDTFWKAYRDARNAAGLQGVRLHDLRHAFVTLQIAAGIDAGVVSQMAGHATVGFTMQTYYHPDDEARAAAAETVDAILGAALG